MKSTPVRSGVAIAVLCMLASSQAVSQETVSAVNQPRLTVEQQWQQLQIGKNPWNNAELYAGKTAAEVKMIQAGEAERYIAMADHYKAFYTANAQAPQVGEAKRLEAMNLMYAAISGNNAQEGRWQNLVSEARRDKTLPEEARFEAAALGDNLVVQRNKFTTKEAHLAAYEQMAKSLIAEFPAQRGGYESLLGVARSADAAKSQELAAELLKTAAPADIKYEATRLAKRYALVGQPALPLIQNSGAKIETPAGTPVVIYGWASWSGGSKELAKLLQEKAGAATLVGVCLDTDLKAAKAVGKELPGTLIYDERGAEGALAQALQLSDAGWVYAVDRNGVIRSVRAQEDLNQLKNL